MTRHRVAAGSDTSLLCCPPFRPIHLWVMGVAPVVHSHRASAAAATRLMGTPEGSSRVACQRCGVGQTPCLEAQCTCIAVGVC
jgi:hypothetical protein